MTLFGHIQAPWPVLNVCEMHWVVSCVSKRDV